MIRNDRNRTGTRVLTCVALLLGTASAEAEITITKAEYASGITLVQGDVERPSARVTLDGRYSTRSNRFGEFVFKLRYLPADCIVDIRAGRDTHPVVIGNCLLPGKGVSPMPRIPR